jgi:cation-transporting ATPase I
VSLDTTDQAVIDGAARSGTEAALGAPSWRLRAELPFEANRGFHAVIGSVGRAHLLSVKGAPEVVLARCTRWRDGDYDQPIDERWRRSARARVEQLARRRLRLLAVAERRTRGTALDDTDVADLTFLGLLALSDPVRPTAASAVQGLQRAGVQVVMVTGDHASTAESVAAELGLLNNHRVVTGTELASLSDDQLDRSLADIAVFARVTPSDKVRIVAALQRAGRTVAMTGDGANDAPAIRLADVGLALGRHCTTAARTAADIVVTDDRIETILDAVTEGRGMWASVRDAIAILLGGNAGEVLFNTGATALTGRMPLSTRQLLLVNLMTDVVPSLAIAVQPPPKRSPAQLRAEGPERSLSAAMYGAIADRALTAAAGASAAWGIASLTGQGSRTTTVALAALVGTQLGQTITSGHGDLLVVAAALGSAGLLAAVIETPVVSQFFGCEPIGPIGWATAISCSLAATGASAVLSPAGRRASSPSEEQ